MEVKLGDVIPEVPKFKYLRSILQKDGEINENVTHRIQAEWLKWRKTSMVVCDCKLPTKFKKKFYHICLTIPYGSECWALKKHEKKCGCNKNENVNMDVWPHKKGQNAK